MTSQIVKVRSNESGNFSKQLNKMTFQIPSDGTTYNLRDSYLLLNMSVTEPTTNQISFGQDNLPMDAVCMFKRVKLSSSKKGVIEEILNVHILRENLNYWQKGENQDRSRALFGYADAISSGGITSDVSGIPHYNSFFFDQPKNTYVWLKDILGIGSLPVLSSDSVGELTLEIELENTMTFLQQRVYGVYSLGSKSASVACNNVAHTVKNLTVTGVIPSELTSGTIARQIVITATIDGDVSYLVRSIVSIAGNVITLDSALDPTDDATVVSFTYLSGAVSPYICKDLALNTDLATVQLDDQPENILEDFQVGMLCAVSYLSDDNTPTVETTYNQVNCTITAINLISRTLTLSTLLSGGSPPVPANTDKFYKNIQIIPLSKNLDNAVWNILKAECVLYKLVGVPKSEAQQVFSTWKWEARQALSNLRFEDTFRLESNVYNVYVMTPLSNKIYSTSDGMQNYRFYVDDQSLTDRDVDLTSSLHTDNMLTVLSNSQDGIKNLNVSKTNILASPYVPQMTPAKIYQRSVNGAPNYMGEQGLPRQLRVYLDNENSQKMVYVFKEQLVSF